MKKLISILLLFVLGIGLFSACAKKETPQEQVPDSTTELPSITVPVDNEKVLVNVGDITMNKSEANVYLYMTKRNVEQMGMGASIWENPVEENKNFEQMYKERLKDILTHIVVLNAEAQKRGLQLAEDKTKEVEEITARNLEILPKEVKDYYGFTEAVLKKVFGMQLLANTFFEDEMKDFVPEEAKLKELYEEDSIYREIQRIGYEHYYDRVKARHILVSTLDAERKPLPEDKKAEAKKKAEDILKQIKNGGDFEALAKEHSDDPGSKGLGGELGEFGRGKMVPEFEAAAFSLKKGEVSELVESTFGYHIIQVQEIIAATPEEVENTKKLEQDIIAEYANQLKGEEFTKRFETIKSAYQITFDDKLFETMSFRYTVPVTEKQETMEEDKSEKK